MNFKEGEVLYFDKPLTWTSFAVVNKIRYHLCRRLGVKKLEGGTCRDTRSVGYRGDDNLYRESDQAD